MSLFNKLFHTNKASPKNTLSSTMSFFFGSSMAGQNVTERTAMQNTAVYACCLLYTSPSPRDRTRYRMPSSA